MSHYFVFITSPSLDMHYCAYFYPSWYLALVLLFYYFFNRYHCCSMLYFIARFSVCFSLSFLPYLSAVPFACHFVVLVIMYVILFLVLCLYSIYFVVFLLYCQPVFFILRILHSIILPIAPELPSSLQETKMLELLPFFSL